ncbi:hypothetical protein CKO51_22440 [Rhodopirellula sp. SM50]|nr:hypothetical protein CKO51_22440 [Rhodopirellula sp. SM50]
MVCWQLGRCFLPQPCPRHRDERRLGAGRFRCESTAVANPPIRFFRGGLGEKFRADGEVF